MKTIYLEVDHIILKDGKPSPNIIPFIEYIKKRFDVYFLTKVSQDNIEKILDHVDHKIDNKELLPLLEDIPVKTWSEFRADGIDTNKNYTWYNSFDFDEDEEKFITDNSLSFGRMVTNEEDFFLKEIELYEKFRIEKISPVYYFIQNQGTNLKGETYDDVLEYDDEKMEEDHEYIQWLFPTITPSEAVEGAPHLNNNDIQELRGNKTVTHNLLNGTVRMRQFYNHNRVWLQEYDHNHLRITRIITSLKLLIGKAEARDFYAFIMDIIKDEGVVINSESLKYWERAADAAESATKLQEKYQGSMIGLAIGDALGVPVEFKYQGEFEPVTDFMNADHFGLPAGHWSDDTAMTLCLANSLIEKNGFDPLDQMEKYKEWLESGYCSSTGISVGIGQVVHTALRKFDMDGEPYAAINYKRSDGNGTLMRITPIALYFRNNMEDAMKYAELSSLVTHGSKLASDACKYYTGLIIGALQGEPKEVLLSPGYHPLSEYWNKNKLSQEIEEVAFGSFKIKSPLNIKGSGYVVESLEAALWAFYNSNSFEEGILLAVNLGDDADTTAAVYGQLAGAFYGIKEIPKKWVDNVAKSRTILDTADSLLKLSQV